MQIKFENIKLGLNQTKNPLFFQLGLHIDDAKARAAGLRHGGMAFCLVAKDELEALMGKGYKPFSLATIEGEFREDDNIDPTKPTLLKFDLTSFSFAGGAGNWSEILSAEPPKRNEPEAPKGL